MPSIILFIFKAPNLTLPSSLLRALISFINWGIYFFMSLFVSFSNADSTSPNICISFMKASGFYEITKLMRSTILSLSSSDVSANGSVATREYSALSRSAASVPMGIREYSLVKVSKDRLRMLSLLSAMSRISLGTKYLREI